MKDKYSGKQVIRAGEILIDPEAVTLTEFDEAMDVLSYWRFQHEYPLEAAITILKNHTLKHDKKAIFAKRLKRYASIVAKLRRFPKMKLKNVQDIAGCRTIVSTQKKLYQVVRELRKRPEFKNKLGVIRCKDYISEPKDDGYRGYHLIGNFRDKHNEEKLIEIQLRTTIQHDWATALEIVDLFTGQALKSNQGEASWRAFFALVSKHFSLMETIHLFTSKTREEQIKLYLDKVYSIPSFIKSGTEVSEYENRLDVVSTLEAYAHSLKTADEHISEKQVDGYVLLKINTISANVTSTLFPRANNADAEKMYLEYEKEAAENKGIVIALVSTTAVGGIKEAYPNYFADSTDFLYYLLQIIEVNNELRNPSRILKMLNKTGL